MRKQSIFVAMRACAEVINAFAAKIARNRAAVQNAGADFGSAAGAVSLG